MSDEQGEKEHIEAGDLIFVYGTLRKGERASLWDSAKSFSVSPIGEDKINGKIYHLGGFPGVILLQGSQDFEPNLPTVIGEVFIVRDASVGALLDAYEGYPRMYDRSQVLTEHSHLAWVYTYNYPVLDEQLIETGDWKNPRLKVTRKIPQIKTGE